MTISRVTNLHELYFEWLYSHIGTLTDPNPAHSHYLLAAELYSIDFDGWLANDDNRAADGQLLRAQYCELTGSPHFDIGGPCSILEMLIALAQRLEYETIGTNIGYEFGEWFYRLLENVHLRIYDDEFFMNSSNSVEIIHQQMDILNRREYGSNGCNGLFPLQNPSRDQRQVELWAQMNSYVLENSNIMD